MLIMYYKLVLTNEVPDLKGRIWTFRVPGILGREPRSEIWIDHRSISRQHCSFALTGDEALMVKDLGSTNGVYIDDNKIDHQVLMPNQTLQVGALLLRVEFSSEDEVRSGKLARSSVGGSSGSSSSDNSDRTRSMPVIKFDPPVDERPWWKRLFG